MLQAWSLLQYRGGRSVSIRATQPAANSNMTVKTVSSDNTWRLTALEDSPVPEFIKPAR